MYAIVLEHSGFFCDVNKHACQEKMYAVNKMPLGIWVGAGLYWWETFATSILSCYILPSLASAVSQGSILLVFC